MTAEIITTILAAIGSGAFSTFLTLVITSKQTIRRAAAKALLEEAGAVKSAITVWQQTVKFLSDRVSTLEKEIVTIRKERTEVIVKNAEMLKTMFEKDAEINSLKQQIENLNAEITALKDRIVSLEKRLLS